jgi:hypothetical protein
MANCPISSKSDLPAETDSPADDNATESVAYSGIEVNPEEIFPKLEPVDQMLLAWAKDDR